MNKQLSIDEFELISEALSVYTNTLNGGKGITLVNRQAGRLLAKLNTFIPNSQEVTNNEQN